MANGGSLKGTKVLGEKGWQALHAKPTPGNLGMSLEDSYFTQVAVFQAFNCLILQGGVAEFRPYGGYSFRNGYYGWMGYGGSLFQWHPKLQIGFAYVPTLLEFHCMLNRKGGRLQVCLFQNKNDPQKSDSRIPFFRKKLYVVLKSWHQRLKVERLQMFVLVHEMSPYSIL